MTKSNSRDVQVLENKDVSVTDSRLLDPGDKASPLRSEKVFLLSQHLLFALGM